MDKYEVALEIAGPAAMFARPDTGGPRRATQWEFGEPIKLYDR
jgi:hypothetical protein